MLNWYYDKTELRNTPSASNDITYETELEYRREGICLIMDGGKKLKLGSNTIATSAIYFHRFYMFHSFVNFSQYTISCTCLFLASKIDETPRRLKDVINIYHGMLNTTQYMKFGSDPEQKVITLESILLETLQFDFDVDHPYDFLPQFSQCFIAPQEEIDAVVKAAQDFTDDSLYTTIALQWEPEIVAVALLHLSAQLRELDVADWNGRSAQHENWWDLFVEDIMVELLDDIAHQVLDLYSLPISERLHLSNVPFSNGSHLEKLDTTGQPQKAIELSIHHNRDQARMNSNWNITCF
ncbi:cyclin-K-like isoform X2 [Photinus pyralis]|uniref:cyclin-K-like isoform X2 n=1 Tax=Photinus pyralis TaxID=7054 RepID=UPI0012672EB7|nr:cyclin-K-like isoform X2 [Photinus pyralis]